MVTSYTVSKTKVRAPLKKAVLTITCTGSKSSANGMIITSSRGTAVARVSGAQKGMWCRAKNVSGRTMTSNRVLLR
jgi:hypothetical protein